MGNELLSMGQQEPLVLWKHLQRVIEPAEHARLVRYKDIWMRVQHLLEVSGSRAWRPVDDDRILSGVSDSAPHLPVMTRFGHEGLRVTPGSHSRSARERF